MHWVPLVVMVCEMIGHQVPGRKQDPTWDGIKKIPWPGLSIQHDFSSSLLRLSWESCSGLGERNSQAQSSHTSLPVPSAFICCSKDHLIEPDIWLAGKGLAGLVPSKWILHPSWGYTLAALSPRQRDPETRMLRLESSFLN